MHVNKYISNIMYIHTAPASVAADEGSSIIPGLKFRLAGFLIRWIPQNMILKRQGKASETQRYSK